MSEMAEFTPLLLKALESIESPDRKRVIDMVNELKQITDDVKTSITHLNEMVSSLRGFSRQRQTQTPPATDPLPILRHAMSVCQDLAVKVHAAIDYKGPRELPRVRMPATELTQVLINLVANGAQAVAARGSPNGKVSIEAHEDPSGMLVLEVRDDGVGMPPDVLKRVGTPFFTTRAEGTGLGLANCQRLIGTAGGRMRIDSKEGVGTTVTILLPIAA
jgi:signal transduction histidine kinase